MTTRPGYISDGAENWIQIGPAVPVGSTVYYQTSAPASPQTGDIWIDADGDVPSIDNSQFLRWKKTVSGGETSLSGNDDSGLSLEYTPAYEQVYLNGVLLVRGSDYTATTGTSITGLTALAASDVVEVFSVVARVVGDVYTQSQADNKYSLITTTGLVLLNTTTFSSTSSVSIDNIFTSTYDNYKILLVGTASTNGSCFMKFRTSGTDNTTSNYHNQMIVANDTTLGGSRLSPYSYAYLANNFVTTEDTVCDINIYSPKLSRSTTWFNNSFTSATVNAYLQIQSGRFNGSTSFDGVSLLPSSGTMTGTIKIYGYK